MIQQPDHKCSVLTTTYTEPPPPVPRGRCWGFLKKVIIENLLCTRYRVARNNSTQVHMDYCTTIHFVCRSYFVRRIRDGFRESQHLSDQAKIETEVKFAEENMKVLKRQVRLVT